MNGLTPGLLRHPIQPRVLRIPYGGSAWREPETKEKIGTNVRLWERVRSNVKWLQGSQPG